MTLAAILRSATLLLFCSFCVAVPADLFGDEWKAGIARRVITPGQSIWLSGYASRKKPSEGKLHDLWAKALVIEDADGRRGVLVTLDLIGIPRDLSLRVRSKIEKQHGLQRSQIVLSTSHTHTGPIVGNNLGAMYDIPRTEELKVEAYAKVLESEIIAVVAEAMKRVRPASISWTNGRANFAVNRRENPEAKVPELRRAGKLEGPVDHDLPVLKVADAEGQTQAVVFGYACHATVLSSFEVSGDYPGFAQAAFEKKHPEVTAMFWAGCGADQNPLPRRTVALAKGYGDRLSKAVDVALAKPMKPLSGKLRTAYQEVDLEFAKVPTEAELLVTIKSENRYEAGRARVLLDELRRDGRIATKYPYPIQAWQVGPSLRWVFLGGEVVVDYSLRLKKELGRDRTWVMAYANDVMAYIPSERVLSEGGYEGKTSMIYYGLPSAWKPGLEKQIVSKASELIEK